MNPFPPSDFNNLQLPVKNFTGNLYRSFLLAKGRKAKDVLHFGRSKTERFDDPHQKYGVCYLGMDEYVCFIETFGQTKPRILDDAVLAKRGLAIIKANALRLVNLTAEGAFRVGASGEISAGSDISISQEWSSAIYKHPDNIDGILYRARNDPSRFSIALFDRAASSIQLQDTIPWLESKQLVTILELYNIAFIQAQPKL